MDISKCYGGNCPIKNTCKRYLTPAKEHQYYLLDTPFQKVDDKVTCTMYYEDKNLDVVILPTKDKK